jgi:hypothetical protein
MATVFEHLPAAVRALAPELDDGWAGEARAACARCPVAALDGEAPAPWSFSAETRCCTAHPSLANFLVGRALARGEPSRGAIERRLAEPGGVTAWGIDAPPGFDARYRATVDAGFGRDPTLRCPYWIGGEASCGVWHDRSSTCRTWFCRHDDGVLGAARWSRASFLGSALESGVAGILVARGVRAGRAPEAASDGAGSDGAASAWPAWFAWCADEAERLGADDLAPLAAAVAPRRADLVPLRRPRRPLPEILEPAVSELVPIATAAGEGDVLLTGYSTFDPVRAPRAVFALLARLDGSTPWRDALAAARAELGGPVWLDEALVAELYRVGAVRDPAGPEHPDLAFGHATAATWIR